MIAQAHESGVASVEWCTLSSRSNSSSSSTTNAAVCLVVTAGSDCNVHLWTLAGAKIGTFGQVRLSVFLLHAGVIERLSLL